MLMGCSLILLAVSNLILTFNSPLSLGLKQLIYTCGALIQKYSLYSIIVETFSPELHGWYVIFGLFLHNTGVLIGSIISYNINIATAVPPASTLFLIGFLPLTLSLIVAVFFFTKMRMNTPARSLELHQFHQAQAFLNQIYPAPVALKVMDNLQLQIDSGAYDLSIKRGWCLRRKKPFLFLVGLFFVVELNGFFPLQFYGYNIVSEYRFSFSGANLLLFFFGVQIVRFLSNLCAVPTVWQISHKILLISGSLVMAQCWLIFFLVFDIEVNQQLQFIITLLVMVYEFFQVWCFSSLQFVISLQMETLAGNTFLLFIDFLFSIIKNFFLGYNPFFSTRYQSLLYFLLNLVSFVFFSTAYHETRNKRSELLTTPTPPSVRAINSSQKKSLNFH